MMQRHGSSHLMAFPAAQSLEIEGQANLASSVQIAQLALKHRQNKNQRQRIVIFIGSPLSEDKVMPFTCEGWCLAHLPALACMLPLCSALA